MKRIVLCFSLILILLCFPQIVISQENNAGSNQDQALELADRLAELRSSPTSQISDKTNTDISGFVNGAYEAWDNNDFDKAI